MRGTPTKQATMQTLLSPEQRVRADHPLREIKRLTDEALRKMSPLFEAMYSTEGRPSIPPETLLKASLLMALYSVRSERLFCEQLDYNLMFRYFLEMSMVENSFNHSTFSKNRERLLKHEVARVFFGEIVSQVQSTGLMSDEHFTVDGTLIEAWASLILVSVQVETNYPRPGGQAPQSLGVVCQTRKSGLKLGDDPSEGIEDAVGEFLFLELVPDMFLRVQLRSVAG